MKTIGHRLLALGALVSILLALPILAGCRSSSKVETNSVSLGQQLQDLDKAHQSGTINDKEYEKLKKSLIKKYD